MTDPQFSPQEQRLIDQLRQSPDPVMRPEAANRLQQRLFEEVDHVWQDYPPFEVPPPSERRGFPAWLLAAAILLLTGILVMVFLSTRPDDAPIQEELISTSTQLPFTPSPTTTLTLTPTTPPTAQPTAQPSAIPTTAIPETVAPVVPLPAAESTSDDDDDSPDDESAVQPALVVVEGPVAEIGANYLLIFDMLVETGAVQPLPAQLAVGSIVRIEGESRIEGGRIIVRAIRITLILPATGVPPQAPPAAQPIPPQQPPPPPANTSDDPASRDS